MLILRRRRDIPESQLRHLVAAIGGDEATGALDQTGGRNGFQTSVVFLWKHTNPPALRMI